MSGLTCGITQSMGHALVLIVVTSNSSCSTLLQFSWYTDSKVSEAPTGGRTCQVRCGRGRLWPCACVLTLLPRDWQALCAIRAGVGAACHHWLRRQEAVRREESPAPLGCICATCLGFLKIHSTFIALQLRVRTTPALTTHLSLIHI